MGALIAIVADFRPYGEPFKRVHWQSMLMKHATSVSETDFRDPRSGAVGFEHHGTPIVHIEHSALRVGRDDPKSVIWPGLLAGL
ncbi:hypothetical protein A9179_21410 [Pseudomonas alcaligenes]|uniref:Uncharacterized protein n=1 Tax=Aquipseudomonas alcaligenes TaxID=43263 RepID=A0ABR7S5I6_AQUAC|nr:hypothetical protein [Pseudomonas alcaligenes]